MAASGENDVQQPLVKPTREKVDTYGFTRPEDFDYETYEEFMAGYLSVLARRASRWSGLLKGRKAINRSFKVKRFIRKGIPAEHRGTVWMEVSGAQHKMETNPDTYTSLLNGEKDQQLLDTINTDIHRTFPENIYFCDASRESKRVSLYNILVAFGHYNKSVGYCQGLNFIVAIFLLILKDEEQAFWLLVTLLEDILPEYYSKDMKGLKVDQEVLGELVKLKNPSVAAVIEKEGMPWSILVTKWFVCLYIDVLPIETVLRIWDCLFYEGSKILFRVALTMIKRNEANIAAATSFPGILEAFKQSTQDKIITDCHAFMQAIFTETGPLPMAQIQKLRLDCAARIS
ncbi:PREDICTED: growth hormone-regulated TBC protein 1-A-like [Branchiostoma belcheri]|uniref:Growth hormone-regulated TBC protein 1 n=1 Tax=Branchiostoma belcheri TaxID=7741 RepID=A0A6P5AJZ1_BRABE|nr:PREDICTED: growth hormone-regulated TBC protein 1-A-like [Branchiostoma belcheri]